MGRFRKKNKSSLQTVRYQMLSYDNYNGDCIHDPSIRKGDLDKELDEIARSIDKYHNIKMSLTN